MTCEECNKIIAEYMGIEVTRDGSPFEVEECIDSQGNVDFNQIPLVPYSESLDALVSVWGKLKGEKPYSVDHFDVGVYKDKYSVDVTFEHSSGTLDDYLINAHCVYSESISQAAARATAKAIQELQK